MQEISIFDCAGCGQRYIMRVIEHVEFTTGEATCACGVKLGSWHGTTSLAFSSLDLTGSK
ncbi:MAG: hypothetical protein ABL932_24175 [Terricaulis sp.]